MTVLRHAAASDAEAIAALHIASWQAAYRGVLPDEFLDTQSLAARTEVWRERLASPDAWILVLDAEPALLGFAASGPTRDQDASGAEVWELYNLHIAPDHRGSGLGGRLFAATVDLGLRANRMTLSLWVVESNSSARRFYEKLAMQPDGASRVHDVGPEAWLLEVRYRRPLRPPG